MFGARSSAAPRRTELPGLTIEERPRHVEWVVDHWPRGSGAAFFVDSFSTHAYRGQLREFEKRARRAIGRRRGHGGIEKGRVLGLFRAGVLGRPPELVAVMLLHLDSKGLLEIKEVYFAAPPDPNVAQGYRRLLIACAGVIAAEVSCCDGRLRWAVRGSEAIEVLRVHGFKPLATGSRRVRFGRGQTVLVREAD